MSDPELLPNCAGVNRYQLFPPKPSHILSGFHTPDCRKLASEVTKSKFKTEVGEKFQNTNVKLQSFTDADIDGRKEPEVTESKFKTEVKEKVLNNNVETSEFY